MCFASVGICQSQSGTTNSRVQPDADDRLLAERYHIAPTKEGLMGALEYPAPEVREYAAIRLAEMGSKEAVPAILSVLSREELPGARIIIASAAFQLGAQEGLAALTAMCQNANWSPVFRMLAATQMMNQGREECLVDVLSVLRSGEDHEGTVLALNLIPRFKQLSAANAAEARNLLSQSIASRSPAIRQQTSYALSLIRGPLGRRDSAPGISGRGRRSDKRSHVQGFGSDREATRQEIAIQATAPRRTATPQIRK